jgi:pimeloyl-ACP methyl ester carboxylesterase
MARELHALLVALGLSGPYVVVGHSMGGTNARLFAAEHPSEVAGMVLVDAPTGDDWTRSFALHSAASQAEFKAGVRELHEGLDFETFIAGFADMEASSRSLGDVPLVILTRGREGDPLPGLSAQAAAEVARVHRESQTALLRLSPNAVQVVAVHSGHFIQRDAPDLVVAAVRAVVDAARRHARVDGTGLTEIAGRPAFD